MIGGNQAVPAHSAPSQRQHANINDREEKSKGDDNRMGGGEECRASSMARVPGGRDRETGGPRVCCRLVRELALAPDTMRKVDD